MILPAPDEAPLEYCPGCGQEYNICEEDSEPDFKQDGLDGCPQRGVYPKNCVECIYFDDVCNLPFRHTCGCLVRMRYCWEVRQDCEV